MKTILNRMLLLAGALFFLPAMAQAHTVTGAAAGWQDGFAHPLEGWDHVLAMLAVGLWAAQRRGRAFWLIPLTFVALMGLGALVGASGVRVPGAESVVLLSVAALGTLASAGFTCS